jgi:hypothetical protein
MFERAKGSFQGSNFFEIATCALWGIWKQRNGLIFEKERPSLQSLEGNFQKGHGAIGLRLVTRKTYRMD